MASYIIHILVTFLCLRLRLVFGQDYTYLGCFYDDNRRESLPDLIYCDRSRHPYETCQNICGPETQYCESSHMTIELCRDICRDQNMKYFGLQAGRQCLCGGFFAPYDLLGQPTGLNNTCDRPCSGDSSQMCGADFQLNVYQINEPASDCFNPGYVLNGDQSQQDSTFYNATDSIDFSSVCSPPSIKNGAASITCATSGNWTDPPPTCTVRCATPTAPIYSNFSSGQMLNDSYAVDDVVLYDCDNDGTRMDQVLICGYYGVWQVVLNAMDCPSPTPPESTTMTMSTMNSTVTSTTPSRSTEDTSSTGTSSAPSSMSSDNANPSSDPMTSSSGEQGSSSTGATGGGGGERTTLEPGKNQGDEMDLIPIIIGAAAAAFLLILVIIVVSVCCSRKRKQKKKNIPFDPALGASFGNPAFEEDETEQSRRGFVQENDYGDRQTWDIGVSDYATMNVDETDRVPPEGKDSPAVNGTEDATYAVVNKKRPGSVTSFKPSDENRVSWATLPPHHNNDINDIYEGNRHSPLIQENGYSEAYYTDPNNQLATPL